MVRLRGSVCFLGDSVLQKNKGHTVKGVLERVDLGRIWGELGSEYDQNMLCDVFREWKLYIIKT